MKNKIKREIQNCFNRVFQDSDFAERLVLRRKRDATPVSVIDQFISELVREEIRKNKETASYYFLSEEEWEENGKSSLRFPAVILDPIDGTREMAMAIPECAFSMGVFEDPLLANKKNEGMIYNPFTGFEIHSGGNLPSFKERFSGTLYGMVSRSEWEKGLFNLIVSSRKEISLAPRGSIAFKLGLLAAGAADFVCSLAPKNIWDIAAGTQICHGRGIYLFEKGKKILSLDRMKYHPPLVWCREEELGLIQDCLKS